MSKGLYVFTAPGPIADGDAAKIKAKAKEELGEDTKILVLGDGLKVHWMPHMENEDDKAF